MNTLLGGSPMKTVASSLRLSEDGTTVQTLITMLCWPKFSSYMAHHSDSYLHSYAPVSFTDVTNSSCLDIMSSVERTVQRKGVVLAQSSATTRFRWTLPLLYMCLQSFDKYSYTFLPALLESGAASRIFFAFWRLVSLPST